MRYTFITFFILLSYSSASAQENSVYTANQAFKTQNLSSNQIFFGKNMPSSGVVGSYYLFDEWEVGDVILRNSDTLRNVTINYDLQNSVLEFKTEEGIKICHPNLVSIFSINNDIQNTKEFNNMSNFDKSRIGLLEIFLQKNNYTIGIEHYLEIKEPTYIVGLDVGKNDSKILKKTKYYFITNKELTPFKRTKSSILKLADNHADKLKLYMKENKINVKKDNDLKQLMKYYIELLWGLE